MNLFLHLSRHRSILLLTGIFLVIYVLSSLTFKCVGDDYIYSFVWEGHSMFEPLSEKAERISSFSDIARSCSLYYMTWGGRVVAQEMAMFFLWMDRTVFNIAIAGGTVLMICLVQYISSGGKVSVRDSFFSLVLIAFCFWSFNINFSGTVIWIDGACNYFFPALFLLLFLVPFVHHYFLDGNTRHSSLFSVLIFFLGLVAGDSNENTIGWMILSGILYIYHSYRKGILHVWMITGLLGLGMGYAFLLFSPGNFIRMKESGETFQLLFLDTDHLMAFGFCLLVQSFLWLYLLKFYRRRKVFLFWAPAEKYIHLARWLGTMSFCFNLIMFVSPESPFRATFPSLLFLIMAVLTIVHLSDLSGVQITKKKNSHIFVILGMVYFCLTLFNTSVFYSKEYGYMHSITAEAQALSGSDEILEVRPADFSMGKNWALITGLHAFSVPFSEDRNHWKNIAFARYYGIKGVRLVTDSEAGRNDVSSK